MRVQFQLRMNLEARAPRVEARPGIHREAQVDDAGIERVNRWRYVQGPWLVRVKRARLSDEQLSQIGENAPVAGGQGIGQRAAANGPAQSQMIELIGARVEAGFDVAQAFAPGQLREDQTDELLPTGEMFDLVVAAVAADATVELLAMKTIQELGKDVLTGVHGSKIAAMNRSGDRSSSNRSHPPKCSFAA